MPLKGEAKKLYMRRYMRRRYWQDKAFSWEKALREERAMLRKALKRVAVAERWKSEHPDEKIDERWLSLAFVWNQIAAEEEEKAKNAKRVCV
jgi:hypothetical protein